MHYKYHHRGDVNVLFLAFLLYSRMQYGTFSWQAPMALLFEITVFLCALLSINAQENPKIGNKEFHISLSRKVTPYVCRRYE